MWGHIFDGLVEKILIEGVAESTVASAGFLLFRVKDWIWSATKDEDAESIYAFMRRLGNVAPHTIDQLIETQWKDVHGLPPSAKTELRNILVNLTQRAALISTQGRLSSSYLRCEHLVEQMLGDLNVVRRRGEQAGHGSDWVLDTYLGSGAYGEVWAGYDGQNPNIDAAKMHPRVFKFFTDAEAKRWLAEEKDTLYHINGKLPNGHPNIVKFYGAHVADQTYPYLEFEYAPGGSLEHWIKEDATERPTLKKGAAIRDLAEGLSAAHELKIAHRDLKPANLVLGPGDYPHVRIADFGLAQVRRSVGMTSSFTSRSGVAGTQMYLPPEAFRPFAGDSIDPFKQDLYAVGVIWYQLIVEELEPPPYNFAKRLEHHGMDSHAIDLIASCLAHPEDRLACASEFLERLTTVDLPAWTPPEDCYDVDPLFREYLV